MLVSLLIFLLGGLIVIAGFIMLINPQAFFAFLRANIDRPIVHIIAVLTRLILGALLIIYADASRCPLVIELVGWVAIIAAIVLAGIGRRRFKSLMLWALSISHAFAGFAGILAATFGGLLIYAFI